MKDARGDVLYVGKAQSLRNRVRSYWQKQAPGGEIHRIRSVIDRVADVEVTQTDSVSEALLLEANLIKRYRPRFNVRLKDDKSYPYIKVTLARRLPARRTHPQARQRRQPLLRAVCVRIERRRVDEPRPPTVPVPDLHDRHPGRRTGAPATLPALPHQALPGPVHRGHLEGRLPGRHRAGRALPRRPPGDACPGASAARWTQPPSRPNTNEQARCATRSEPSSGRWRARRWRPSPEPSSTSSVSPARTTRPPSSCSSSVTGS